MAKAQPCAGGATLLPGPMLTSRHTQHHNTWACQSPGKRLDTTFGLYPPDKEPPPGILPVCRLYLDTKTHQYIGIVSFQSPEVFALYNSGKNDLVHVPINRTYCTAISIAVRFYKNTVATSNVAQMMSFEVWGGWAIAIENEIN